MITIPIGFIVAVICIAVGIIIIRTIEQRSGGGGQMGGAGLIEGLIGGLFAFFLVIFGFVALVYSFFQK